MKPKVFDGLKMDGKSAPKLKCDHKIIKCENQTKHQHTKVDTLLTESGSINWLKTRCQSTAQPRYLKTRDELDQEQEVKDVFTRIDYDGSGKIDMTEMGKVFKNNGINMTRDEIE